MLILLPLLHALLLLLHPSSAAATDPKIDLVDLSEANRHASSYCRNVQCPKYSISEVKVPKPLEARDYENSYWLATPWYQAVNGSCFTPEVMSSYYDKLIDYYRGMNTMGLRMERTRPIRVVARTIADPIDNQISTICGIRFFIPDMSPLHPPAPIVNQVVIGWDNERTCYIMKKRGSYSWASIARKYESMMTYMKRLHRPVDDNYLIVDIFSGYGIREERKYVEVVVCRLENLTEQ